MLMYVVCQVFAETLFIKSETIVLTYFLTKKNDLWICVGVGATTCSILWLRKHIKYLLNFPVPTTALVFLQRNYLMHNLLLYISTIFR